MRPWGHAFLASVALAFAVAVGCPAPEWSPPCPHPAAPWRERAGIARTLQTELSAEMPLGIAAAPWVTDRVVRGERCVPLDVDGDGVHELGLLDDGKFRVENHHGDQLWEYAPEAAGPCHNPIAGDLTGDGRAEVVVTHGNDSKSPPSVDRMGLTEPAPWLVVLGPDGGVLHSADEMPLDGWPVTEGTVASGHHPLEIADLDGDGRAELLVFFELSAGDTVRLRRVAVYDTTDWSVRWTLDVPAPVMTTCVDLLDSPGLEILMSTTTPGNEFEAMVQTAEGPRRLREDRFHALIVTAAGHVTQVLHPGDGLIPANDSAYACHQDLIPYDMNSDGTPDLVSLVVRGSEARAGPPAELDLLSGPDWRGQPAPFRFAARPSDTPGVGDVDGDGIPEVVMGVADGALYRFTPDLRRKPGLPVGREMPILHCLADCNGDGTLDVVGTAGTELFVATFGPDMEMHLGRTSMTPVPYALVPCETDGDGDMEMVALHRAPGGRGYEGRIIELAPLTVASPDETSRRSLLDLGGARALSLSPRAALLVAREDDEVRIVDAVMAETLLTWPDAPDDIGVTWSPSGDAVAAWVPGGAARMASAPFDAWQEAVLDAEAVTLGDAGEVLYLARDGDLFQHDPVTGRSRPVAAANTDAVETDPLLSPDGRLLAFLREGGGGDPLERRRRDVCVLDLDSRATRLLTSDRAVLEMLADDGRTSPVPFARADASIAPRALELAWMPDSLTLYVAGAVYGTSGTGMDEFAYWGGPTAEDDLLVTRRQVWTVDAHGGGLTRARLPALHAMGRPMPSPRGNWLAVLVDPTGYFQREPADPMARPEPSANLAIASLAQSGSVTLAEGGVDAFAWVDGLETTIRYASGGVLWELDLAVPQVREAPALSAGERRLLILETVGVTALSLIALTVLGVVAYRHGSEWLRMVRLVRRGVKLGFEPQILREMLSTMEELSGIAHSLKNAATVLPMGPGGTATPEDVLACIDQDGLPSLTRMAGMLRDRAGTVAARREEWDRNLSGFTGYVRGELRAAWDAAVACVPRCEAIVARLSAVAASDDPDLAEAADLLEQLRARLEPGTGLMESLDRGLRPFLLGSILTEARERVRGRAEGLGIDLSAVPVEAHRVRVCGDPAPLVDVVHTLLTNSLEAVVERARREGEDYRGEIDLQVERNDLLTMRVMDNGCGIEPSLLAQLNDHTGVSTKSPARGTGLRAAATILQRYPGSGLRLHSDGHDEGATAELRLGKA